MRLNFELEQVLLLLHFLQVLLHVVRDWKTFVYKALNCLTLHLDVHFLLLSVKLNVVFHPFRLQPGNYLIEAGVYHKSLDCRSYQKAANNNLSVEAYGETHVMSGERGSTTAGAAGR